MALLRVISIQNMSELESDLSRSLKVKSNGAVGLLIYHFHMSISHNLGDKCT